MNIFKKYLAVIGLIVLSTFTGVADTATYNPTATTAVSVLQRGVRISQIVFANAATNAVTLTFTDAPTNVLTYVVGAYTNRVITTPATVTTFTNIYGVAQSSTNTTFTLTDTAVAASTNNFRTVLTQLVPASSTVTFTPPLGLYTGFGLAAATTATNVIATINYVPIR
jgi:hypothetical protein